MTDLHFFDAHCHPQLSAFDADREAVFSRMRESGVGGLVVGVDLRTSAEALSLAQEHDFLWASVGLHPNDAPGERFDAAAFEELAGHERTVAIGECGLDYYRQEPTDEIRKEQHARFGEHVDLALKYDKPLIIHCRPTKGTENAHEEMLGILSDRMARPGGEKLRAVMHFFTSSDVIAWRYLALGCYLSFPCVVTFTDMYDEAVRTVPEDRILSETDSPFAAPASKRGKRNEPVFMEESVAHMAKLRGAAAAQLQVQILKNAEKVFKIKLI